MKSVLFLCTGNSKKIHWDIEDPAKIEGDDEAGMRGFRKTRDVIKQSVIDLIASREVLL